jgi:hypothetical protein
MLREEGTMARSIPCTGYLEHPFKNLAVSSVIYLELLGKLNPTLTGFRTDLPSSQHRMSLSMCRAGTPTDIGMRNALSASSSWLELHVAPIINWGRFFASG